MNNNGKGDLGDLVQRGYRFALSLTHNESLAEDLVQDAWFSVLKVKGPWNREYLFTTIRNRFIDYCRRENRVAFERLDKQPEIEQPETNDHDQENMSWSFDDQLVGTNGKFGEVLGKLRAQERAVLYLSAVEGFSARQIGELLDWPRGTVLSMMHRGRDRIRELLKQEPEFTQ